MNEQLKAFIDAVIVPALVEEFLREQAAREAAAVLRPWEDLEESQTVTFTPVEAPKGARAVDVEVVP